MATGTSSVDLGKIIFVDNHIPPLQAGEYMIKVEQNLLNTKPTGKKDTIDEGYVHTRHIAVRGERFVFGDEFKTTFPPPENRGKYDNVLPHLVFERRTLPWERSPDGTDVGRPWLALLVFHASDPPPTVSSIQVGDLVRAPFKRSADATEESASTLPANAVSYDDGFRALASGAGFTLDLGEQWYDQCQAIDIPVALFNTIAPSLEDMTWLAHARTVSSLEKAGIPETDSIDYSVVVANRLPKPNSACTVHLVSLEGMAAYLPANGTYAAASILLPDGKTAAQTIRLVSLRNWNFTSIDPTQSFDGYLKNLSVGPLQLATAAGAGDNDADKAVRNAFRLGYTAMNHRTRLGDKTVSWYRGPMVPFKVPDTIFIPIPDTSTVPFVEPIKISDQLMRYDPGSGMYDSTYAAAWEIGRLLALGDKAFSVALYNWKRANAQRTALAAEQEIVELQFGEALGIGGGMLRSGGAGDIMEAAANFIATTLREHIVSDNEEEEGQ
jgi:hypothetical protein